MKKNYQKPAITSVQLQATTNLAGSGDGNSVGGGVVTYGGGSGPARGREGSS